MSFDNRYPNRKDHRSPYHGSKAFDRSCRNHGSCGWCSSSRQHATLRREPVDADLQIKEALTGLCFNDLDDCGLPEDSMHDMHDDYEYEQFADDWSYCDEEDYRE